MRRRSVPAAGLALLVVSGGCSFDLTDLSPAPAEARLTFALQVRERGGPADVNASFHPGRTPEGVVRPLGDESMRVDGVAVVPSEVRSDGWRLYHIAGLNAAAPPLLVRPPLVAGLPDAPPEFAVEPIRIVTPDSLIVARPGTIEIALSGVSNVGDTPTQGFWMLEVHADTGGTVLTLTGPTPPPPILRLPGDLLPSEFARGRIEMRGLTGESFASATGSYEIQVFRGFGGSTPLRILD